MADRRLHLENPDIHAVDTEVVEVGETGGRPWARLRETPFYPEGGGQPADRGTVGEAAVIDVRSRGAAVLHSLDRPVPLGPIAARVDSARRFDLSQQHTAQHLITAILHSRHHLPTTAFHLGETYVAIEFDAPVPSRERLEGWEDEGNAEIRADRAVRIRWAEPGEMASLGVRSRGLPDGHEGPVRLVEIEGVDLNTCGGTHVDRLSRIQMIRILEAEPARGGTRIRFVAGNRVLARLRAADALARDLKDRLATAPEEFARTLDAWVEERRTLARRTRDLEAIVAASLAERIAAGEGDRLFAVVPIASTDLLRSIAFAVVERRPGAVVALVGSDPGGGDACLHVQSGAAGPPDVAPIGARLRAALGARGGGRGRTFQGRDGRWTGGDAPPAGLFES